ncbi:NfeD family protein [Dokdonella sp.]|uniref:NfeD family protein n=1 Tax=Dokdonella sp. TaxID=2291710 RepID=UPI0031C9A328|nr:nodulation protein NfeD [Dokdonella sp.]
MIAWFSRLFAILLLAAALPGFVDSTAPASHGPSRVVLLQVDGAISPASADYVVRGIAEAEEMQAALIVLQLDTPGGLDRAMRDIIKAILASPVPVVGYVAPAGSRAASAGTYILYACHVAAMAPATNLGAATPISIIGGDRLPLPQTPRPGQADDKADGAQDGDKSPLPEAEQGAESRKVVNDAVAYIRALAEQRGRNADWAEQAVREAVSITADQALKLRVIDLVAPDLPGLLAALDGRKVQTLAGDITLHTRGAVVDTLQPDWRSRFLAVIADPSVAYLLLLLGLGGLLFEGYSPGAVLPGVVGAICLLLALYAFQMLPVNYAGLALIALGVALIIAETFVPTYGTLGIGGVVAFVTGSVILMDTDVPGFGIPLPLLVGISIAAALALAGIVWLALRSQRQPQVSGREQMVGSVGVAVGTFDRRGMVHIHGERWQAMTDRPVQDGQALRVTGIDGLILRVEPLPADYQGEP